MCRDSSAPRPAQHSAEVAAFRRDGFAVVRQCVDGGSLRTLVDEYEATVLPQKHISDVRREVHGAGGPDGDARLVHVSNMCELPGLARLAAEPRLLELASACLGGVRVRPVINTELFDKPPDGNSSTLTPPHQDNFYFGAREPGVALWITLDETEAEAGTVRFVRGSHLKGLRFHEWDWGPAGFVKSIYDFTDEDDDGLEEVSRLLPGDVVVHSALTIHYAPTNLTSGRRRGLVVNYVAEHVAYTLADDLYKPALVFRICAGGRLVAQMQQGWQERHALAASCVQCALAFEGVGTSVKVEGDVGKLVVEVGDPHQTRQAVDALIRSGHVFRDLQAVTQLPPALGLARVPPRPAEPAGERLSDNLVGVWQLTVDGAQTGQAARLTKLAIRMQARCGLYVDVRIPQHRPDLEPLDLGRATDAALLSQQLLAQRAEAGVALARDGRVARHSWASLAPSSGSPGASRTTWREEGGQTLLLEEPLFQLDPERKEQDAAEVWRRLEASSVADERAAALELIDDRGGRFGLWVVIGSWFARVIGRRADDILSDVACRSLMHACQNYVDGWGVDLPAAVYGSEAIVGRVEAPGTLRALHAFGANGFDEGSLLLGGPRRLRRDGSDGGVLVEGACGARWRVREWTPSFSAFGSLKRTACE